MDFHWHFHPEIELTCIEKGKGTRTIGHSVHPYEDGDLCLIGPNLPHAFGSNPRDRTGAKWTVIHFQPERFGGAFWQLPQNLRIISLLRESRRGIWFPNALQSGAREVFCKLVSARSADFGTVYLLELLAILAHTRPRRALNPAAASYSIESMDQRIPELLAWVEDRVHSAELSQAEAAERLRMSPRAFCRYFRHRLGKSFRQYVNELRVARACSKLLHSEDAISEIAFESGFNNLANFNRRFRETVRCTPTEYRAGRR